MESRTDRLLLRTLKNSDIIPLMHAISQSVDTVIPWLDWCYESFDNMDSESWINHSRQGCLTSSSYELAAFERITEELVGCVYVSSIDNVANMANIGYWITSKYQGRGYAAEATEVAENLEFNHLLLIRLELVMDPQNVASIRTAEKPHATFECKARNRYMYNGEAKEGLVYSIIPFDLGYR
ncbi:GNAT family N-acetyltransferase [Candidatus Enterovibrio escicola]|uniref:GNAT family N-acetyltransferase n=1 Tax=Candidatus Enterovibrio escicola TaxID=1927127 RepID=UPI001CC25ABF|nr:GNAT family protein [Candidatus Enterovibrio escacola]